MSEQDQTTNSITFAKALADATRQEIMELTCCRWISVGEIAADVGVSQPTVSHHLAILRDAGLVNSRAEGKHTYYSLNQERVAMCCGELIQTFAPETGTAEAVKGSGGK